MSDETNPTSEEKIGIPERLRVKRRYTMSEAALRQRREAANQPKPGMTGKRNAWKHGMYAQSFLTRLKPCKSTCPKYPCNLIEEGTTEPGGDCLDAAELLHVVRAVHDAIKDPKNADQFQEIAALNIANSIKVLEMLHEDILRDGSLVKSEKYKDGELVHVEYKLHPALLALPKMIADLGMNPDQFMITPKAQARHQSDEEGLKTIASMFQSVGRQMKSSKKDE